MPRFAVIIPAAGRSTRFGGTNKLLERLNGDLVLHSAILSMWNHEFADAVFLATNDTGVIAAARGLPTDLSKDIHICPGGPTRAHSVLSALRQVPETYTWVAVHDAARPLASLELIDRVLNAAVTHGAAGPALPVSLTVRKAHGPLPAKAEAAIPRDHLWTMQTPQIMRRDELLDAFHRCPVSLEQVTDDVQLLELVGKEVWLVPGDEQNLKITTSSDLKLAELLLDAL